jgi:hypothetical protein
MSNNKDNADAPDFASWRDLRCFLPYPQLRLCIERVISSLPRDAEECFDKTRLRISLDDCEPGNGRTVRVAEPGPSGISQCVILKPRLNECSHGFICYIVAHELAHAMLNNGGWGAIQDREDAADALAASWGFAKLPYE